MNMNHLKYLIEVEKFGSISKAAQHLYMKQPQLSKIIRDMEEDVKIKIFERSSKGIMPTPKGRAFLEKAKDLIEESEELERMFNETEVPVVALSLSVPRASYISSAFVQYLKERKIEDQEVKISYHETNTYETIDHVYEGSDDLGIIRFPIEDKDYYLNLLDFKELDYEVIWTFEYRALMSQKNPLASFGTVSVADLSKQIELVHGDIEQPDHPMTTAQKSMRLENATRLISIYERGSQFEILAQVPGTYMWVSPMPEEILKRYELIDCQCIGMKAKAMDVVITRRHDHMNQKERCLIEYIKERTKL